MIGDPSDTSPLYERLQMLHEYVWWSRRATVALCNNQPLFKSNAQVLLSGNTIVYCRIGKDGYSKVEIHSPSFVGSPTPTFRIHFTLPYATHVEVVDLSQDLLVVSNRVLSNSHQW